MTSLTNTSVRPRLLAIGYGVEGTGLTRVMDTILNGLADRYEILQIGLGYQGQPVEGRYRLLPSNLEGGDIFGVFQGLELIESWEPQIVLILHDIWQMKNYVDRYLPFRGRTKLVTYIPFDGNIADSANCLPLADVGTVVVYTDWARSEVERAFGNLQSSGQIATFPPIEVIGHGVETSVFHPLPGLRDSNFDPLARNEVKRLIFPGLSEPEDSFVVLNASRPGNRKRIDLTIEGFAKFARDKPANVCLCLHQALGNERSHEEYMALADRCGIRDRIERVSLRKSQTPLSDEDLNLLYNACDVGINTSMGEGWGLVSFEHAAAGAAQIVPRHSACASLWNGVAEFLDPVERDVPRFSTLELETVSSDSAAATLQRLYDDRELLRRRSRAAFEHATRPEFRWPVMVEQWDTLFRTLIS